MCLSSEAFDDGTIYGRKYCLLKETDIDSEFLLFMNLTRQFIFYLIGVNNLMIVRCNVLH